MRFVTWNMRSGTDRKWPALASLGADAAVVCEASQQPKALSQPTLDARDLSWAWEGANANKGLAIASWGPALRRVATRTPTGRWSLAATVHGVTVVGAWSCPRTSGAYAIEVGRALDAFTEPIVASDLCIVAGDFNVSGSDPRFGALRRRMDELGLVSAYHHVTGDPFGIESALTWHARHPGERSSHIDFVFVSRLLAESISGVEVRAPEEMPAAGLSDHSAIVVDFDV